MMHLAYFSYSDWGLLSLAATFKILAAKLPWQVTSVHFDQDCQAEMQAWQE